MGTKSNRSSGTQPNQRGVARGVTLVDPKTGFPVCVIQDSEGKYRLCVDAKITAQSIVVDVDLDPEDDQVGIAHPDRPTTFLHIEPDGSINVNTNLDSEAGDTVALGAYPDPIFDKNPDTITTSNFEEIYRYTSTDDDTRIIGVESTVSTPSNFRLKIDGTVERELRSSPMQRNVYFEFKAHRFLTTGQILTIEAKVERFILSSYTTFTALEGYLV